MDAWLLVVLGSLITHKVAALSCIECTHIAWNNASRQLHIQQLGDQDVKTSWIGTVDKELRAKERFNPACADKNPVWFSKTDSAYTSLPTPAPIGTIEEHECHASKLCNYMYGDVEVYVKTRSKTIELDVHVRNCAPANSASEADYGCLDINTHKDSGTKARDVAGSYKNVLGFLGEGITVRAFVGKQCLCKSSPCHRSSADGISNSVSMIMFLITMPAVLVV